MISGGIKFFSRSESIFADGTFTVSASSANESVSRAFDRNKVTYWRSTGSNDTVTETITVTWGDAVTFDRLFLIDHNFKEYNVQYDVAGVWTHFASVVGIDGSLANLSETTFSDDTSYYEFTPVTTTGLRIQVVKTQVANEDKYISQVIVTTEMGTLEGYPDVQGIEWDRNERSKKMLSGKTLTLKSEETFKCTLNFKNYPPSLSNDIDLMFQFFDLEETFLVWLCGGRRGSDYFRKQLRGWRLRDVFSMQTVGKISPDYTSNSYVLPVNFKISFVESVD